MGLLPCEHMLHLMKHWKMLKRAVVWALSGFVHSQELAEIETDPASD